ncbi:DUF4435 domain-containing protein [Brevundimonas naejangsanensis]
MADFSVPTKAGPLGLSVSAGHTLVFLGANGAGKTRLGVNIEDQIREGVHRVGAHRSLTLNTKVPPPSYDVALRRLFFGYDEGNADYRHGHRWGSKPAVSLLSDFDHVVAALYADENRTAVQHRQAHLLDAAAVPPKTKLDVLKTIWTDLLPHRELIVLDADIRVRPHEAPPESPDYDAGDLSDGERVIFYLIGQCLLANSGIIIVDEPELHINKAILSKLWDLIEASRADCGFIYLTHDLEFAASRRGAARYALRGYETVAGQPQWDIDEIPEGTGLSEEVVSKIVGSRQPVLFVEGDGGSLDSAIYRRVFGDMTVIPIGDCDGVIHAVSTFRKHAALHRVGCAGIIDADGREAAEIAELDARGIYVLAVSEIENVLLLPRPFAALAKLLQFDEEAAAAALDALKAAVFIAAQNDLQRFCIDYTRRRIDAQVKRIGLSARDVATLEAEFGNGVGQIDVKAIYEEVEGRIKQMVDDADYEGVLSIFDHKGLLSDAARILGLRGLRDLEEFIGRSLRNEAGQELHDALVAVLPTPAPS